MGQQAELSPKRLSPSEPVHVSPQLPNVIGTASGGANCRALHHLGAEG